MQAKLLSWGRLKVKTAFKNLGRDMDPGIFPKGLRFVAADRCRRMGSSMSSDAAPSPMETTPVLALETPAPDVVFDASVDNNQGLNKGQGCYEEEGRSGGGGGGGVRCVGSTSGGCLGVEAMEVEGFAVGDAVKHRIISSRLSMETLKNCDPNSSWSIVGTKVSDSHVAYEVPISKWKSYIIDFIHLLVIHHVMRKETFFKWYLKPV